MTKSSHKKKIKLSKTTTKTKKGSGKKVQMENNRIEHKTLEAVYNINFFRAKAYLKNRELANLNALNDDKTTVKGFRYSAAEELGCLYRLERNYKNAQKYYDRAIEELKLVCEDKSIDRVINWSNVRGTSLPIRLGQLNWAKGLHREALRYYEIAYNIISKGKRRDRNDTLRDLFIMIVSALEVLSKETGSANDSINWRKELSEVGIRSRMTIIPDLTSEAVYYSIESHIQREYILLREIDDLLDDERGEMYGSRIAEIVNINNITNQLGVQIKPKRRLQGKEVRDEIASESDLSKKQLRELEKEHSELIEKLINDDRPLVRGTLHESSRKCGKKNCRCAEGKLHKSKYLSTSVNGRTRSVYIRTSEEEEVASGIKRYQDWLEAIDRLSWFNDKNLELLKVIMESRLSYPSGKPIPPARKRGPKKRKQ